MAFTEDWNLGTNDLMIPKQQCIARTKKRQSKICGEESDTTRKVQAAPGLWIHAPLCHYHQHIWDEALDWGGAVLYREMLCSFEH